MVQPAEKGTRSLFLKKKKKGLSLFSYTYKASDFGSFYTVTQKSRPLSDQVSISVLKELM